jgi:ribosomal protein S18 acetylase RimI-like enzyme
MPHRLTVRSATADDEAAIAALWQTCGLVISYNDPAKDFRFARGKSNSVVLVGVGIHEDGNLVGSVMVGHDGHRGWIYYVAADPNYRKQGIGRRMMGAAEEWLKGRKVVKMMLLVRETNTEIIDFYKRLGFETIPRVIMQKWLN